MPSPWSSKSRSPEPPPVIVPVSNSTWIATLPVSGAIPPPTIAISASAVPELKVIVSPISYPVPAALTRTSSTPPPDISPTWIREPVPPPPDIVASSPTVSVPPSFVIVVSERPWLTVNSICTLGSALLTPVIVSPLTKVPVTVSLFTAISETTTEPSWNIVTFSTIAVASLISESAGLFACVITWPVKNIGLFTDCAAVCVQRLNVSVENLPSDTLSISVVGL